MGIETFLLPHIHQKLPTIYLNELHLNQAQ